MFRARCRRAALATLTLLTPIMLAGCGAGEDAAPSPEDAATETADAQPPAETTPPGGSRGP